jgi:hypothetical protein
MCCSAQCSRAIETTINICDTDSKFINVTALVGVSAASHKEMDVSFIPRQAETLLSKFMAIKSRLVTWHFGNYGEQSFSIPSMTKST